MTSCADVLASVTPMCAKIIVAIPDDKRDESMPVDTVVAV
jgi:hypothetical protein